MSIEKKIEAIGKSIGVVQLKKIGNSTGMILPHRTDGAAQSQRGRQFHATDSPTVAFGFALRSEFREGDGSGAAWNGDYRNTLAELAK